MTKSETRIIYNFGKVAGLSIVAFIITSIQNGDLSITTDTDGFNISYNKHIALPSDPKLLNK